MEPIDNGTPPDSLSAYLLIHLCVYLQDGKWHSWDDVVKAVSHRVPRTVAGRRGEADRARVSRYRTGKKGRSRDPDNEAAIRAGARTLLSQAVRSSERWFEKDGPRLNQRIRMKGVPEHIRKYLTM